MRSMSTATIQQGELLSVMILEAPQPTLWGRYPEQECYGLRLVVSKVKQGDSDWTDRRSYHQQSRSRR
jgi:hypothetical protein